MSTSYSILSASIRPEIGEQITIGLLMLGNNKIQFRYSKDKLNITKELLSEKRYKYLKDSIKQVDLHVKREFDYSNSLLTAEKNDSRLSSSYISYLNVYANNLLIFSQPKTIEIPETSELFDSLYSKFIDQTNKMSIIQYNKFDQSKIELTNRVEKYYNIDQWITDEQLPRLSFPMRIDMIGRNDVVVFAQWIDLQRGLYHVKFDIGILALLNNALRTEDKKFVVSSEPNRTTHPEHHHIWKNMTKNDLAEYVDLKEVDKIEDYAERHGVQPLITQN